MIITTIQQKAMAVGMLMPGLFLQQVVLTSYLLFILSSILFELIYQCEWNITFIKSFFVNKRNVISIGNLKQSYGWNSTKPEVFLNKYPTKVKFSGRKQWSRLHSRFNLKLKSVIQTARQSNVFISYSTNITCSENIDRVFCIYMVSNI